MWVGKPLRDLLLPTLLVGLVGVEDDPIVFPGAEVAAGGDSDRPSEGAAALHAVEEVAVLRVVAEVRLVLARHRRCLRPGPGDPVRRDGEALVSEGGLVAAARVLLGGIQ